MKETESFIEQTSLKVSSEAVLDEQLDITNEATLLQPILMHTMMPERLRLYVDKSDGE